MEPFELPDPEAFNGPDEEANEEKLQAELQKYQLALEQEFEDGVAYKEGKLTPVEIRERTKEILTQAVPVAVARLQYLATHGKNETVQLKAATYIIDKAVGKEISNLVGDPLEALLAKMANAESSE